MDIRRGIIRAFDAEAWLADVQIVGSMATVLSGVPVAKQIGADLLTSGTKCGVLFFDETNPSDACVVFVYEGAPVPSHPAARVYRSTSQSIPHATWTPVSFDNERWDTDDIWAIGDPTKLVCKTAGKYLVVGSVVFAANTSGLRILQIWQGAGPTVVAEESRLFIASDGVAGGTISTIVDLAVNDYVRLAVYQSSGGALNVNTGAQYSPEFMMARVG